MTGFQPAKRLIALALGALGLAVLVAAIRFTVGEESAPSVLLPDQLPACTSCDARHKRRPHITPAIDKDLLP
jgi:hypothetical protein